MSRITSINIGLIEIDEKTLVRCTVIQGNVEIGMLVKRNDTENHEFPWQAFAPQIRLDMPRMLLGSFYGPDAKRHALVRVLEMSENFKV